MATDTIGPTTSKQPRAPSVGKMSEPDLRHRRRQLEQHRQRARFGERQAELRDQQRQQRREDVAVAVDDEVDRGDEEDGGIEAQAIRDE
jgi:hypothetical protein